MTLTDQKSKELQEKYSLSTHDDGKRTSIRTMHNGCYVSMSREELEAIGIDFIVFENELKEKGIEFEMTPGNPNHYYKFNSMADANIVLAVLIHAIYEYESAIEAQKKYDKSHMKYACPFCEEVLPSEAIKQRIKAGKDFTHCPECGELIRL